MIEIIIIQSIVALINIYIAFTPNIKNIYIVTFLFNLTNLIMYVCKQDWITVIAYISITLRSFIYIYRNYLFQNRVLRYLVPILCISVQLGISLTGTDSFYELIPIIIPAYVCFYLWFMQNLQKIRISNAVCNSMWCIYNLHSILYIAATARIIVVFANIIAYIKNRNQKLE